MKESGRTSDALRTVRAKREADDAGKWRESIGRAVAHLCLKTRNIVKLSIGSRLYVFDESRS